MSRTASIERKTGETDVRLSLSLEGTGEGARSTGVGFLDHMLDLLARHGRLDLDVEVTGDLRDRRPPHRRGHRRSCSARRSTRRSATARGITRYGVGDGADGRGAGELRDRHLGPPADRVRGRRCRRAPPAASSTS